MFRILPHLYSGGRLKKNNPYLEITKPRITFLVLLSAAVGFFAGVAEWNANSFLKPYSEVLMAAQESGFLESFGGTANFWQRFLFLLLGTGLASASGSVFNNILDRDMDILMDRTKERALPKRKIKIQNACLYGFFLLFSGFLILYHYCNPLSAGLVLLAVFLYVIVYTLLLKRKTSFCTVLGGVPGALPPLVGYAAAVNNWGSPTGLALLIFYVMFLWQPPHFWALALMYKDDYKKTVFKMLPSLVDEADTKKQILIYTILMTICTLFLIIEKVSFAAIGFLLLAATAVYLKETIILCSPKNKNPMGKKLFKTSVFFMSLFMILLLVEFSLLTF